jgi:hypothetical protein
MSQNSIYAHRHQQEVQPSRNRPSLRLHGRVIAWAMELCEQISCHVRFVTRQPLNLSERRIDAILQLSDGSTQLKEGQRHQTVGLCFGSAVSLNDLGPLGGLVEVDAIVDPSEAPPLSHHHSSQQYLASSQISNMPLLLQVQHIRPISMYELSRVTASAEERAHTSPDAASRLSAMIGWVPSKFQYIVDRWCPHVAGHRHAKELLILNSVAVRLCDQVSFDDVDSAVSVTTSLRVLLRGPKGCGKTLLLAAFEELYDPIHTLVLGKPPTERTGNHGPRGSTHLTKCPIDAEVLLPHFAPLALPDHRAVNSSVHDGMHCGRLLSSSIVLVDDWNVVASTTSCGPRGSIPRAIMDALLDDTWVLPLSPNSSARYQPSVIDHGNCMSSDGVSGLQRGRFLVATDSVDVKHPLSALASHEMYAKFHLIVALEVVSVEADAAAVASSTIRAASQMTHQRLSSVDGSCRRSAQGGRISSSRSVESGRDGGRRSIVDLPHHMSSMHAFGSQLDEQGGGFSNSLSEFFLNDTTHDVDSSFSAHCPPADAAQGRTSWRDSGSENPLSQGAARVTCSSSSSFAPIAQNRVTPTISELLNEVVSAFDREALHHSLLPAWAMYLLTTSGEQHPPQQQQVLEQWCSGGGNRSGGADVAVTQLPSLVELLEDVIRDDIPGFVEVVVTLTIARHALDPDLPLIPDCMIDTLRVVLFATTPPNATASGRGPDSDSAAQRKRIRCINADDGNPSVTGKKKLVGKKQIARRFHESLHQASRSGSFENGEVPIGVCRVIFDKAITAVSGVSRGGSSGIMFEEIVASLSYDGMVLKGKHGGLKPL